MRKLSLLMVLAVFGFSAMAQYNKYTEEIVDAKPALTKNEVISQKGVQKNQKAPQAATIEPFWTEDFENGFPTDWTNTDDAGIGGWIYTDATNEGAWTQSERAHIYGETKPGNHFMHFPLDFYNSESDGNGGLQMVAAPKDVDGTIETGWIDLQGHTNVALGFATWFRLYNGGKWDVNVSTDGNTWTTLNARKINGVEVGTNDTPESEVPEGNVVHFQADISSIINGATQVKIQFRVHGTSHYFVSIDDVCLYEPLDNDMKLSDVYAGNFRIYTTSKLFAGSTEGLYTGYNMNYSEVPYNVLNQLHLGGYLTQNGLDAVNARLEVKMDSMDVADYKTYNSTTTIPNFTPAIGDTILYTDTTNNFMNAPVFYHPNLDASLFSSNDALMTDGIEYLFKYEAISDNEDLDPSNNKGYIPYAQTQGRYSYHHQPTFNDSVKYHDHLSNGHWQIQFENGDAVLNDFDINSDNPFKIYGVRVFITNSENYNTYDADGNGVTITPVIYFLDNSSEPAQWIKLEDLMDPEATVVLKPEHKGRYLYMAFDQEKINQTDFVNGFYRVGFQIENYNKEGGKDKRFSIGCDKSVRQAWGHCAYFAAGEFKRLAVSGSLMIDAYTTLDQYVFDEAKSRTGIEEVATIANSVKVYPNPTNGVVNIANAENASIEVYTITGTLVRSIKRANVNTTINLSNLSKGTYLVKVVKDNNVVTKKINLLK